MGQTAVQLPLLPVIILAVVWLATVAAKELADLKRWRMELDYRERRAEAKAASRTYRTNLKAAPIIANPHTGEVMADGSGQVRRAQPTARPAPAGNRRA